MLTFGSSFEYESGRHSTCFAMNSDKFVECWQIGFFPEIIDPLRNPTALRARSSGVLADVSSLRLVFLLSHQMIQGVGTRETQWLWSRYSVRVYSKFLRSRCGWSQKLHFCSKELTRATKIPTICSTLVILVVWAATV